MRKPKTMQRPAAARNCITIGDVERLAGIGQSHEERFAFWQQLASREDGFDAGRAELYRRIEANDRERSHVE